MNTIGQHNALNVVIMNGQPDAPILAVPSFVMILVNVQISLNKI